MSNYTYTASEMVQLPRLSGPDAMALGEQLLSAARPHGEVLGPPITRALTALTTRHGALKVVLRDQGTPEVEPGTSAVPQDRAVDGCWAGLDGYLVALTRLPATYPQAAEASEIRAAILPDGLAFLNWPYVREWTESELRLERMSNAGIDARIEALGGGLFLGALREAHAAYGKVLGMTSALEPAAPAAGVRDALAAFTAALRDYVVKVMAAVEPDDHASQALADRLLAPLAAWTSMTPARGGNAKPAPKADPPAPDAGAPAPAAVAPEARGSSTPA